MFALGPQSFVSSKELKKLHRLSGTATNFEDLQLHYSRFGSLQDCAELTEGFFALREICETGAAPNNDSMSVCRMLRFGLADVALVK